MSSGDKSMPVMVASPSSTPKRLRALNLSELTTSAKKWLLCHEEELPTLSVEMKLTKKNCTRKCEEDNILFLYNHGVVWEREKAAKV